MRIILCFLLIGFSVSAQDMTLRKGVVIDSIPVSDTLQESYALFLPSSFQGTDNPRPIIFVFDSEGRGRTAARLFVPTAEEQGYIIASSNDLNPNNDFEENVKIAVRLINGVTSRIPVDFDRVSAAGFSEGARVATSIPAVFNNIHGVIAVSDSQLNYEVLQEKEKFIFVGIVGVEDFSSYGIRANINELETKGYPVALYIFDGAHEWPDAEVIALGIGSLTLEAMKEGKRPKDQGMISKLYQRDFARVSALISKGSTIRAYDLLDMMQAKYNGLRDISEIVDRKQQLSRSRNFIDRWKELEEVQEKEVRLIDDFIYYLNEDVATANFENLGWWNYQKLQLEQLVKNENELEADMASRMLGMLKELTKAKRRELNAEKRPDLESELLANMIQTIFDPTNYEAYKKVISLSAIDNDYGTALFYLEEILKHGFDNMSELYDLEGTLALKMTPEFNWLVRKYLGSSRYYDMPEN